MPKSLYPSFKPIHVYFTTTLYTFFFQYNDIGKIAGQLTGKFCATELDNTVIDQLISSDGKNSLFLKSCQLDLTMTIIMQKKPMGKISRNASATISNIFNKKLLTY